MNIFKIFLFLLTLALTHPGQIFQAKTLLLTAPEGGDFKIPTASERNFPHNTIDTSQFRGFNLFIVFGFSKCRSVCLLTLNNLKTMYSLLPDSVRKETKVLFISVDNERDSVASLNDYVTKFDPSFLSGTADDKKLKDILKKFGARYYRFKTETNSLLVDHTSDIFLVNKKGIWADTLSFDKTPQELQTALQKGNELKNFEERFPTSQKVELLPTRKNCQLDKFDCTLKLLDQNYRIRLSGRPVHFGKDFTIDVEPLDKNPQLTPSQINFEGVEVDMGYLRPTFQVKLPVYKMTLDLPACELKKMNWTLTLLFKNKTGKLFATRLNLTTSEP